MHYNISWHLVQARIADLRQHAQHDTLARATRRHGPRRRSGLRPWALRRTRFERGTPQAAVAGDAPTR